MKCAKKCVFSCSAMSKHLIYRESVREKRNRTSAFWQSVLHIGLTRLAVKALAPFIFPRTLCLYVLDCTRKDALFR